MEYIEVLVAPANPDLDIVFVHGLNPKGQEHHARKTWTHSGGDSTGAVFWPQALLPESVPSARILLFAYNSSILANASNAPVHGHANTLLNRFYNKRREENEKHRPIIFIAHSLGGLLVKQALVEAKLNPLYSCIKASTYGLVFFATPHSGGNGASVADSAAKLCSALTGQAKNSLLETLEKASLLNEISKDHFRPQIGDYEVLTFMETRMMNVKFRRRRFMPQVTSMASRLLPGKGDFADSRQYIVDMASAKLGAPRETALGLDRNHSEICKFLGRDDRAYQGVEPNLRAMAGNCRAHNVQCDHTTITPQRTVSGAFPYVSSVPGAPPSFIGLLNREHHVNLVRRCDPFVGRETLTREICNTWTDWNGPSPRRISLSGLGSVGKTQLSRSVLDQLGPRQIILWLRASSAKTLREDLLLAALDLKTELLRFESRKLPLGEMTGETEGLLYSSGAGLNYLLDLLKVWLRTTQPNQSKILIVLDDLDGLEPSELSELSELISGDHIEIIYSTRDPMMADQTSYMYAANFDVPPLEPRDAQDLFDQLRKPHPSFTHFRDPSVVGDPGSPEPEVISKLVASVGHLPAAIINATHYFKDNFAFTNPYALSAFLAEWEGSEAVKGRLLQFRRRTFIYPHTMQASFEVSTSRLKRSVGIGKPDLYTCSLYLLRILSMVDVKEFAKSELESLCALLGRFIKVEKVEHEILRYLSSDTSVAHQCVTELVQVSLLSDPEGRGILLLNDLTKACVWLTVKRDMGETAQSQRVLQQAAKFLIQTWRRTSGAELATASEAPITQFE